MQKKFILRPAVQKDDNLAIIGTAKANKRRGNHLIHIIY